MLLALMTYTRVETYRSSQIFQLIFEHYMQGSERGFINQAAETIYNDIKVTTKSAKNGEKEGKKKSSGASSRISIAWLFDKKPSDQKPQEVQQMQLLLKDLILQLYSPQSFFQKAIQENPYIVDELLSNIRDAIARLPSDKKMKKTSELSSLILPNEELNTLLYKMLRGATYEEVIKPPSFEYQESNEIVNGDKSETDEEAVSTESNQVEDHHSPKGYYSLLDFITMNKSSKIRVYLAPKEVLQTIFPDKGTVERILYEREEFYREARRGADTDSLETHFKNQFDSQRNPSIDEATLDYSISKTNPKTYLK